MTRSERTYYLVLGGYNLSAWFIAPVYPLFLLSRGCDLFQINVVLAVYLLTVVLFEIPTGAVADLAGRKASFIASCLVRMGAYGLYAFADSFAECLVYEVIDGIGTTLASGALDAWAVDGMRAEGERRPLDRVFARANVLTRTLMIAGGIAGSALAGRGWTLTWLIAAGCFGTTAILAAVTMHEPRRRRTAASHRSLVRTVREGLDAVRAAPVLLLICALSAAGEFAFFPVVMLWQAHLTALSGAGVWLMGWVWAILNLAALAGSALIPRLLGRLGREVVLAGATFWRGVSVALAASAGSVSPAVAGLALQSTAHGVTQPVLEAWTNEHIVSSERRATVLSVWSMSAMLGGSLGLVVLGLVARAAGIPTVWFIGAAILALVAPGYLVLGRIARGVALDQPSEPGSPAAERDSYPGHARTGSGG